MKNLFLALLILFAISENSPGQLLNGSFEDWQEGEPVNWLSNDISGDMVTQSSDAYEGNFSLRLKPADLMGSGFPAFLFSSDTEGNGHPITQKYTNLKGYYKLSPAAEDVLWISIVITESDSTVIGGGMLYLKETKTSWTEFNIPIQYDNNIGNPQMAYVTVGLLDTAIGSANINSVAFIDNFSLDNTTSVDDGQIISENFLLEQNYPNPFNPSTKISWSSNVAGKQTLKIYNVLGNEVATLVDEFKEAGSYSVEFNNKGLTSGVYFYTLSLGNKSQTKKMILLQ